VPDLLDLLGGAHDPPVDLEGDLVGAMLPGVDIWLGVDRSLYGPSEFTWRERIGRLRSDGRTERLLDQAEQGGDLVSVGPDGHVLQIGPDLSRIYRSWWERELAADEREEAEGQAE
jgi:hypothetical protein